MPRRRISATVASRSATWIAKCRPRAFRDLELDQVHLLRPEVEPRATEGEVGPIAPNGQPEHAGVELDRCRGVADVDRHVVDPERLHLRSLTDRGVGTLGA